MSRRTDQVNELLRETLSELISRELHDPRLGGIVSVTRVDVSPDLRRADAFVSVLGSDDQRDGTMAALSSARPFIRRELSKRLHMRNIPAVTFVSDRSMEEAQRLTDLMRRTAEERGEQL